MQNTMLDSTISNSLQLFQNAGFKVRVIMRCSDPWFVAKDVAACIEHSNVTKMCDLCRDKDKVVVRPSDLTSNDLLDVKNREYTLISESGLYRILAKCNLPKCEPFESWVFDEVLPSIRKTGGYSIAQPTVPSYMLASEEERAIAWAEEHRQARLALEAKEREIEALEVERDEAIRTKHHFVEGRDAKVCGELGGLRTQNEALRKQIGDAKKYKAVTAISWLPDYFDISNRGLYGSLAANLKKVEAGMSPEFAHIDIPDSRYGTVKAYHVAVIERLHEMVQADENLMAKYRKIASV